MFIVFSCAKEEVSPKNEIVGIYNTYSLENDASWTENGSRYQIISGKITFMEDNTGSYEFNIEGFGINKNVTDIFSWSFEEVLETIVEDKSYDNLYWKLEGNNGLRWGVTRNSYFENNIIALEQGFHYYLNTSFLSDYTNSGLKVRVQTHLKKIE